MIYLNQELLTSKKALEDDYLREKSSAYKAEISSIRSRRKPVVFKTTQPMQYDSAGVPEPAQIELVPLKATVFDGDYGSEEWIFSRGSLAKGDDGSLKIKEPALRFKRKLSLDPEKDADLIFFLRNKSPLVRQGLIIEEDKAKEAQLVIERDRDIDEINYLVKSTRSPISREVTKSEDTMFTLAKAWNVYHTDELSYEEVQLALLNAVTNSEKLKSITKRGFKEFIKDCLMSEDVGTRAMVQQSIDKGYILFDNEKSAWLYSSGNVVCNVPVSKAEHGSVEYLITYLASNPVDMEKLNIAVQDGVLSKAKPLSEADVTLCDDRKELEKWAKERGLKYIAVSSAVLKENIINHINDIK